MGEPQEKERQERPLRLEEQFYCKPRRRNLELQLCLDDYVTANALAKKRSACWLCPQGKRNRKAFAEGAR